MELENQELFYLVFCHAIRKNFLEKLDTNKYFTSKKTACSTKMIVLGSASKYSQCCYLL